MRSAGNSRDANEVPAPAEMVRCLLGVSVAHAAHCAASPGAFDCVGFVASGVPAKSRPPGSASSGGVPTAVHATDSRAITAIGGAHRPLSRFTRGANTGGLDFPRTGG